MTVKNDLKMLLEKVRYEINYIDDHIDQFTVPVILTEIRASKIIDDTSIRMVRFTPILQNGSSFSFEFKDLIF